MATLVPRWSAFDSEWMSVESPDFTKKEPTIEASMPMSATANGKSRSFRMLSCARRADVSSPSATRKTVKATRAMGATIEPA